MRISIRQAERLLFDAQGLQKLVGLGVCECDFLEFKIAINRSDPKWRPELRADCAALSTVGAGFLIVGIDDSRDGRDAAAAIVGVADAADLKKAVLDTLADGLSPPLKKRDAVVVPLSDGMDVLVVRVEGRRGYPMTITDNPVSKRHVVREAGRKIWLTDEKARVRRHELELRRGRTRIFLIFFLLLLLFGVATVAVVEQATRMPRRRMDSEQRSRFVAELSRSPGRRLEIWEVVGDAESNLLAGQIADALSEAGWIPERSVRMGLEAVGVFVVVGSAAEGGCMIPYDSTGYRAGYALKGMNWGVSIGCEPWASSDVPVLVVGRNPQGHVGKMVLEGESQPKFIDGAGYPAPP
jgi:hypothetical protein